VQSQSVVELRGTFMLADLVRFQYFHVFRRAWLVFVFIAFLAIVGLPLLALLRSSDPEVSWWSVYKSAVPFVSLLLLWAFLIMLMPYRNARKQLAGQIYLREPVTMVFSPEAINSTGTGTSGSMAWSLLKHVRETKSLFLLYHAHNMAAIIPKRFFESPDEMERWRQLVAACVDPKLIERPSFIGRWC
jgi:hypothetical protein